MRPLAQRLALALTTARGKSENTPYAVADNFASEQRLHTRTTIVTTHWQTGTPWVARAVKRVHGTSSALSIDEENSVARVRLADHASSVVVLVNSSVTHSHVEQ